MGRLASYAEGKGETTVKYSTDFKSIRNDVSAQEWQARTDLAACYRLVDAYGMTDLIYNHITRTYPRHRASAHQSLRACSTRRSRRRAWSRSTSRATSSPSPDTDYSLNVSGYVIHRRHP